MRLLPYIFLATVVCLNGWLVNGENILVLMMIGSKSHRIGFEPLFQELGKRGHQLTILSHSPNKPTENITEIGGPTIYDLLGILPDAYNDRINTVPFALFTFGEILGKVCENYFQKPEVSQLLTKTFDMVMIDIFANECAFGFANHFKPSSVILLSPMPPPPWVTPYLGLPSSPSLNAMPFSSHTHTNKMSFFGRAYSFFEYLRLHLWQKDRFFREMEASSKKYFPDAPSTEEFYHKVSLILSNTHVGFHYPILQHPDVIEVGGMNCRPAQALPKDLQEFLDGANEDGFIYFSMGSYISGSGMPEEFRRIILTAFGKLKQRVLWKYESETMAHLPGNVKLVNWAPQQDILGHKNIRIFITQAGLLSIHETVYHGVPIIAIPIFCDQDTNVQRAMELGFALKQELVDITEESLSSLIQKMLGDTSFRNQAKLVSERFRTRPEDPLNLAVFWTEYVLKFKGAPFLRSVSRDLNFWQYYSLDVMLFVTSTLFGLFVVLFQILKVIICKLKSEKGTKTD